MRHRIRIQTLGFTEDGKEGISAFLGKRSPDWQGK